MHLTHLKSTTLALLATYTSALLLSPALGNERSVSTLAEHGRNITVKIESSTQGSGVLVERSGNLFKILTSWHVLRSVSKGEEVDVILNSGEVFQAKSETIKRLGSVDLAEIWFAAKKDLVVAKIGNPANAAMGTTLYAMGYPLATTAVPRRIFRFVRGELIANASQAMPNGYELIYSNPTLPGMSGGAVLNQNGELIGIHGLAETETRNTENEYVALKTGNNLAVPVHYAYPSAKTINTTSSRTAGDYLAEAESYFRNQDNRRLLETSKKSLALKKTFTGYFYLVHAYYGLGQSGMSQVIAKRGRRMAAVSALDYYQRGMIAFAQSDFRGAEQDYRKAVALEPENTKYLSYLAYSVISNYIESGNIRLKIIDLMTRNGHEQIEIDRQCLSLRLSAKNAMKDSRYAGPAAKALYRRYTELTEPGSSCYSVSQEIKARSH